MARNDLARPRGGFRTREDGTLSTRTCETCMGVLYRVPEGMWLHWGTLVEGCAREAPPIGVSKPREGAKSGPRGLDTPERGLARARCAGSYRRPSWEWMGCR